MFGYLAYIFCLQHILLASYQKRVLDPLKLALHRIIHQIRVLGLNLGPLQEQLVLIPTEPSLHALEFPF